MEKERKVFLDRIENETQSDLMDRIQSTLNDNEKVAKIIRVNLIDAKGAVIKEGIEDPFHLQSTNMEVVFEVSETSN